MPSRACAGESICRAARAEVEPVRENLKTFLPGPREGAVARGSSAERKIKLRRPPLVSRAIARKLMRLVRDRMFDDPMLATMLTFLGAELPGIALGGLKSLPRVPSFGCAPLC